MKRETDVFDDIEGMVLAEARKLFSEKVIDHFSRPRNLGENKEAQCFACMSGMCGDTVGIYVNLDGDTISQVNFVTDGCGPTIACGSALTCMAKGLPVGEAMKLKGADLIAYLDGLPRENTHCADLAVNTLRGALEKAEVD